MNGFSTQVHCKSEVWALTSLPKQEERSQWVSPCCKTPVTNEMDPDTPIMPKKSVHYNGASMVALQRFQDVAIREGQHTNIHDQGIWFDTKGFPYEEALNSRDSSHVPAPSPYRQGPGGKGDTPGHGGPRESGDGGGDSSPSERDSDCDEEMLPPSDEEDKIEELSLLHPNSQSHSRLRTNPGIGLRGDTSSVSAPTENHSHHQGYGGELDSYRDKGNCHPSKYLKAMHAKFHHQINDKVSVTVESLLD